MRPMPSLEEIITFRDTPPPPGASPWLPGVEREVGLVLIDHDLGWTDTYSELSLRVRNALGFGVLALEHVGSTAVPGLPASRSSTSTSLWPTPTTRMPMCRGSKPSGLCSAFASPGGTAIGCFERTSRAPTCTSSGATVPSR